MESTDQLLVGLASIIVVGIAAQWLAWRARLPSILLLLVCGLLAGPVTGFLDPDEFLGELLFPLVSLSVAVILFEGGLGLNLAELRSIRPVLVRLMTVGVLATLVLSALLAHWVTQLSWPVAILFGAIMTVTGPTVIGPLLRHVRPRGQVGPVAKWEGIVADVIGATLAVLVFHAILGERSIQSTTTAAWGLVRTVLVGGGFGVLGTVMIAQPLRRHWIPDALHSPATLAVVLAIFTVAQNLQPESGLLAVTLMGFLIANQKAVPKRHIIEFKENLRVLLISSLFIVLPARLTAEDMQVLDLRGVLFVIALILVVRPVAVFLSTVGSELEWRERLFLCWMAPRGIVVAAVSALFAYRLEAAGFEDARRLAPLAFLVIIGTVAFYGLSAAFVARRLGLAEPNPQGVLLVGAGRFARGLAQILSEAGLRVALVDTNHASVSEARLAGLTATYGSALTENVDERLDLGGIGRLLAITPNEEVNALATMRFAELFGRSGVYQLVHRDLDGTGPTSSELRGRELFAPGADYWTIARKMEGGATLKRTNITATFDFEAFREQYGERALPLAKLDENGKLEVFTADSAPEVSPGDVLISLLQAEA